MNITCLGLPHCNAFSFVLEDLQKDLEDLVDSPDKQQAVRSRFSKLVSLLFQTRTDLFNYFPQEESQDRIPMNFEKPITILNALYEASRSSRYRFVSQRCHFFFFYYVESMLICLSIAQKIELSSNHEELPPKIDLLEERVKQLEFTDLVPILEAMRPYVPPQPPLEKDPPSRRSSAPLTPRSTPSPTSLDPTRVLPTTYIPAYVEDRFNPQN